MRPVSSMICVASAIWGCAPAVGDCKRYLDPGNDPGSGCIAPLSSEGSKIADASKATNSASGPYNIDTAGTVFDTRSGRTWQRAMDHKEYNWAQGKTRCNEFALNGGGWRLPSQAELQSILEKGAQPAINLYVFPDTLGASFWSATQVDDKNAYNVNFENGFSNLSPISSVIFVRCVR